LREIYEARLQAEGYTIVTAKDGEEALVVAKAERPDLIISDIMMPKISGFEMLDILRNTENLKNVPVIMLTALGQNDDQQRADKLGADRYLVKSQVTLEDIVRVAHELLGDSPKTAEPAAESSQNQVQAASASAASTPPVPRPSAATTPSSAVPAPTSVAAPPVPATPPPAAPQPTAPVPTAPPQPVTPPLSVAPDPVPSTAPASAPIATQTAPVSTTANATTANDAASTTAQEGAAVEARIEDFVTGASQDTAPPQSETSAAATDTDVAGGSPTQAGPAPTNSAPADKPVVDQELVKETAQKMEANAQPDTPTVSSEPEPSTTVLDTTQSSLEAIDVPAPSATPITPTASPVVHDKVIKPLEIDPKKDINTLLALEDAKEASNKPPEQAVPVIVDDAKAPAQPAPAANPHATALGANPIPSSVITPEPSDDSNTTEDTSTYIPEPPATAFTQTPTNEEAGKDLNNIAL
jgi:CheY-like chemotaxis protein